MHGVHETTVRQWCVGRRGAPPGVLEDLAGLHARIERSAGEALAVITAHPADLALDLGYAADDAEARGLGWPTASAQAAMLGIVVARLHPRPVRLVPRGSTPATAAAADAHGR